MTPALAQCQKRSARGNFGEAGVGVDAGNELAKGLTLLALVVALVVALRTAQTLTSAFNSA